MVVHWVVFEDGAVRPLCGYWGGAPSWTRIRGAVSCPRCLAELDRAGAAGIDPLGA